MNAKTKTSRRPSAQDKLLEAALTVIRQKGYAATTVDDLCAAAGVTKGAFFHHFTSKEDLGVAAANYWSEMTGALFAAAPYHAPEDPFDRVLAYIDFRAELLAGELHEFTCLVGTMVQEVYGSSDPIREACRASIEGHAQTLEADIAAAVNEHGVAGDFTPKSLALHTHPPPPAPRNTSMQCADFIVLHDRNMIKRCNLMHKFSLWFLDSGGKAL